MEFIKKYGIVIVIVFALSMFIEPAVCFFILGSIFFYAGVKAVLLLKRIRRNGIACTGTITEYESDSDGYKTPFVEFTTLAGDRIAKKPYLYASTDADKLMSYKNRIGQPVPVLYDPNDPKKFILTDQTGLNYFVFMLCFVMGSAFLVVSICSFMGYIKLRF